ncbi:hypothetical protein D3C71_1732900 [compost metagenome]
MDIQVIIRCVHIRQHNHRIFLGGHIVQNGIHYLGEFFVQMIKAFGNTGHAGHLLKLVTDYLERLVTCFIMQQCGDHDIICIGVLYIDIADVDPGQPLD